VAKDLGTTVTGIQAAITLYTLVMAALSITGGKIGSLVTSLCPNLTVPIIGWSLLEGLGAALIMPVIVALVAGNVPKQGRAAAYVLIVTAGAITVTAGPLIGGDVTAFASWRWVFVGEVVIVGVILCFVRVIHDAAPEQRALFDGFGAMLSMVGLALTVYGVLRSGTWGWVRPKPNIPSNAGVLLVFWFVLAGLLPIGILVEWEWYRERTGRQPLFRPSMFASRQMTGGLIAFFFQFLIEAGIFFTIPLFLPVILGLNALQTGLCLLPLSLVGPAGLQSC
jgi:MFS family permease